MIEYPKTENLFTRNEETHKLNVGDFRLPEFEQIKRWHVTEKIDGTNMRLILNWVDDDNPDFYVAGRSDNAQIPKGFIEEAVPRVGLGSMVEAWRQIDPSESSTTMIVFGEGYGAGIQKGGIYSPKKQFRAFDVVTIKDDRVWWRSWEDVVTVSLVLGISTVPFHGALSMEEIVWLLSPNAEEYRSVTAQIDGGSGGTAEGIVARTDPYLYNFRGDRVMFKLKMKDLA